MTKNAVRVKRNKEHTKTNADKPQTKEKFLVVAREIDVEQQIVPKLIPATQNQRLAVNMLQGGKNVLFMQGSAGTGKSMIACWWAATQIKAKKVDKIFLVRAAVTTGKSTGHLPGTETEKLAPYFAQTLVHLGKFMGEGFLSYCIEKEKVELKSCEFLRGRSFEDCIVIIEESQNLTKDDLEMLLTRLGKNCTLILTGDQKQNDLKSYSGLQYTIDLLQRMQDNEPSYLLDEDLDTLEKLVGVVSFTPDDVVRSGLTRAFVRMYYHN
jgi:phosphate starvation-inducible PhoH-like protein